MLAAIERGEDIIEVDSRRSLLRSGDDTIHSLSIQESEWTFQIGHCPELSAAARWPNDETAPNIGQVRWAVAVHLAGRSCEPIGRYFASNGANGAPTASIQHGTGRALVHFGTGGPQL